MQKNLVIGMLAHVDAGKTTLTEAMLFESGCVRCLGRVDHQDAFLDTDAMERKRGITIFSKQAVMPLGELSVTVLDTPGHIDFSAEMERTLRVLDCAVLVISGSSGIQGHTITLWRLLARYRIPALIFVNKMDLAGTDHDKLMSELKESLNENCVSFSEINAEEIALCDEDALSQFVEHGSVSDDIIASLICKRKLFPCFFGSALKLDGIGEFLAGLGRYARPPQYPDTFGAKVYKITTDKQGSRLTHMKITGGKLATKTPLTNRKPDVPESMIWTEKVNQIRVYSGEKYTTPDEVFPGTICAVTGLNKAYPGQGIGIEPDSEPPALEAILSFRVILPQGCDPLSALKQLRQLEEEDPQLAVSWVEQQQEIHLSLMGEVQMEILSQIIMDKFGLAVTFDAGKILYRETIATPVVGIGHFEPLRHYAEVHLLLEPGPRGSGLRFDTACSEDILPRNWQRLVLTHLEEREHPGVLTGAPITDMKITLLIGRAHLKHTEGGDFRQATYRAVRQGLMQAKCVLLEPWYTFRLEIPNNSVGRAMTDLRRMSDDLSLPETAGESTVFTGSAPVAMMRDYAAEVTAYTRGLGRLSCTFTGFAPCRNQDEVIASTDYDAERDTENPADSVFCSHGAGFTVKWNIVKEHAHLDSGYRIAEKMPEQPQTQPQMRDTPSNSKDIFALDKELQMIYERTYGPIKRRDIIPRSEHPKSQEQAPIQTSGKPLPDGPEYLLVDGYNIIYAWEDLNAVARENMDAARQILMNILSNYRAFREREIILVFDAYKVSGGLGNVSRYHKINVVYTKEAETADAYIEKVTYDIGKKYRVTVATSDRTIQLIIMGHGAVRVSPETLRAEIEQTSADITAIIQANNRKGNMDKPKHKFNKGR